MLDPDRVCFIRLHSAVLFMSQTARILQEAHRRASAQKSLYAPRAVLEEESLKQSRYAIFLHCFQAQYCVSQIFVSFVRTVWYAHML